MKQSFGVEYEGKQYYFIINNIVSIIIDEGVLQLSMTDGTTIGFPVNSKAGQEILDQITMLMI